MEAAGRTRRPRLQRRASRRLPRRARVPDCVPDAALSLPERRPRAAEVRRPPLRRGRDAGRLARRACSASRRRHRAPTGAGAARRWSGRRALRVRPAHATSPLRQGIVLPLVVVGGSIAANYRNGGIAWERLSWALGLRRLGTEILVVDQLDRERCVHPDGLAQSYNTCLNRAWFEQVVEQFGLAGSATLVGEGGEILYGPPYGELLDRVEASAMLVNVAGNVRLPELKRRAPLRVLVDVDPGLTQLRLAS